MTAQYWDAGNRRSPERAVLGALCYNSCHIAGQSIMPPAHQEALL